MPLLEQLFRCLDSVYDKILSDTLNCGFHYESQKEAEKCCFIVVAGQYKMGVNGGFQKQAANEGFQTVNNIRVSAKLMKILRCLN